MFERAKTYRFLFEELVKRDFKRKYKRTALGMAWSAIHPLLQLLVMSLVFAQFFGRNAPHYIIYIFCGNLVYSFFADATRGGMGSLLENAGIFTKVNVPKYLFLFSRNVQALMNFGLVLAIFFVFAAADGLTFSWRFLCLLYPIVCLIGFNVGVGLVLSAWYVFFRDTQYLYDVFTQLLMYLSAIFYTVDAFSPRVQAFFYVNPIYGFIRYFRLVVIEGTVPSGWLHGLLLADTALALWAGFWMYRRYNTRFLYYV